MQHHDVIIHRDGRCLHGWVRCCRWAGGSAPTSKTSGSREQPTSEPEPNCVLSIFIITYSYSVFMYIMCDGISNDAYLIVIRMFILIEVAETDFYGGKITSDFTALKCVESKAVCF